MAPLRIPTILLVGCLALSGCISMGDDFGNNDSRHSADSPPRVESLSVTSWASGKGGTSFDVPDGFEYIMTTYSQGGQTFGTSSYVDGDGQELDGGPAATHAGGFQLVRSAPPTPGTTTFSSPYGAGGGQFTATAYDNVAATLLLALSWGGSRADSVGLDTRFGFYAPPEASELTVVVQANGQHAGTITLEDPDGTTRDLVGPAAGATQNVHTIPSTPGVWKLHVAGSHSGGHQIVVSAVPEVDDIHDWF